MILRTLKEGTLLLSPSGIVFKVKHVYFKKKYRHSLIVEIQTNKSYIRSEVRFFEIYNRDNKNHIQRANKWKEEEKEYQKRIKK